MKKMSTTWRLHVWIAIFAILMNALAPSISHAMAYASGEPAAWDICRADTKSADAGKLQAGALAHCGYCLPHAGSFAILPGPVQGAALLGGHALRPFLFYHAPTPLLALHGAPPRGPPALS
jgi:hypothetical protein